MTPNHYFDDCLMVVGMLMKLLIPVAMIGLSPSSSSNVVAQQSFTSMHHNTDTMNEKVRLSNNDNRNNQRFLQNLEIEEDDWSNYYSGSVHVNYGPNGHPFDRLNNIDSRDKSNSFTMEKDEEAFGEQLPNEHNVHREEQQEQSFTYQPIRINFATDPIDQRRGRSTEMDQQIDYILNSVLKTATEIWASHLSVIPTVESIPISSADCVGKFSDTLQSQTFNETDLVLIVDGLYISSCRVGVLAYASICATEQYGRPLIGFMNFCLFDNTTYTTSISTSVENQQDNYNNSAGTLSDIIQSQYSLWTNKTFRGSDIDLSIVEVAIHEMAHVLGVFSPLFPYFRDKDNGGMPYTSLNGDMSVPIIAKLCVNGTIAYGEFPSDDVILTVPSTTYDGTYYQYLVTPRVAQVARNFFNCSTMIGARLAYDISGQCIGSHWHERILYTELLSPIVSSIGENVLSPFTLALLDDSGWYQVDYHNSELPAYGIAGGCDFVDNDCIVDQQVPDYIHGEFCNQLLEIDVTLGLLSEDSLNSVFCEPSYHSWAVCDLFQVSAGNTSPTDTSTEVPINYFNDTNIRSLFTHADSCPIPAIELGLDCTKDQPYNPFYPGEKVGTGSRCFNAFYIPGTKNVYLPSCMEVICDDVSKNVIIRADAFNLTCEYSRQEILIPGTSNAYIICPRLQALCPKIFSCPYACSGRGTCVYPQNDGDTIPYCECFDTSNTDPGCSLAEVVAARPLSTLSPISSTLVPTSSPLTSNVGGGGSGSLSTFEPTSRRIGDLIPTSQPTEFDVITKSPIGMTKPTTPTKPTTKTDEQVGFRTPSASPVVVSSAYERSTVHFAVSLWMIGAILFM